MANPRYSEVSPLKDKQKNAKGAMAPKKTGSKGELNMKTAAWPGLPGKTGPNRSAGIEKLKIHAKSEGL